MAYNTSSTRRKSSYLHDLDCRTIGAVKTTLSPGETITYAAVYTADEAVEAGECIAMVRVPRGFTVTDALLTWSAGAADAVIGLGDPFACGRFLGPLLTNQASGIEQIGAPQGTFSCSQAYRLSKVGRAGDGCGVGYTYTCETDLVVTVGYGQAGFGIGGSTKTTGAVGGGYGGSAWPSGGTLAVVVTGYVNPLFTNQ